MMEHASLRAVPFTDVTINDAFWSGRLQANIEQTIPYQYEQCKTTGRVDALKLEWKPGDEPVPHIFWDSDIAKWIEAASYTLATKPDAQLEALLDEVIALLASAQQPDGYLNTHFTVVEPGKRWTNLRDAHELYCAGHLIEAAVAHYQATGKRSLLDVICRYCDHIAQTFGPNPGQKRGYCGHEEIELALVKLYHVTGERRYLDLSAYFINERGQQPHYFDLELKERLKQGEKDRLAEFHRTVGYEYNQSHKPVREQVHVVGHAVRAMYLYSAMADLAWELQDDTLKQACERLWADLCEKKLYITGGIGPSGHNEGFTRAYDLPNETAYAETCAAIGLVFWAHRMLHLDCDRRYADVMERALYNGVISGVSLDGRKFFYENPLASNGQVHRQDWFECACCPPNVARLLASFGNYIYSQREEEAVIHLFVQGSATLDLGTQKLSLKQQTRYPWDGEVRIQVDPEQSARFRVRVRQPGWCRKATVRVNGEPVQPASERGYLILEREWSQGDVIELTLHMPVERVYAHPQVREDRGRVALQRGPLVYCLEEVDNSSDLDALLVPQTADFTQTYVQDLASGAVALSFEAQRLEADGPSLYRTERPRTSMVQVRAVPYCLWDNRSPGEMLVWLREA
ncbi:hypothetical protein EI42_02655 [Thermosporothrix hazakensis]|jgi:DUF1680 family protein|uniref:Glycoside hydrolase family 127 protein n=1 Tax=Thermosporothrix hazakensis TaxID=644383 RepID=A0A326U5Y2_THEHA|nr:beta-L-arabinofuranosidase domain-containing protein [Thermosporothrix hazakensis]PZW29361.1 hypothetical protein EI42_02655 [Thermosporothrix hazakensis]GCE45925.1 hypothetical protein KTH_07940 [Thermosporothrix hazakensis]